VFSGLYAIADTSLLDWPQLLPATQAAIEGGARVVQFRDKTGNQRQRHQAATALQQLCQHSHIPFMINDDVDLAAAIAADGVHLGRADTALIDARKMLSKQSIIGISCYADLNRATAAEQAGADYVAFGAFFPSSTKPLAPTVSLETLTAARAQLHIPIVAIGGITPDNAAPVVAAGANMLAVISGLWSAPDITVAATRYNALFAAEQLA